MADQIEETFSGGNKPNVSAPPHQVPLNERIRDLLMDGKARRAQQIADELDVPEDSIRAEIDKNKTLERNERGWITLAGIDEMQDA